MEGENPMSLFHPQIWGGLGAIILGAGAYGFLMHILGARIQLHPLGIEIVEPTGHLRGALVGKIEKRLKKHPAEEDCSVHVHKQLMERARKLRIQTSIGFLTLSGAMISDWCFDLFQNGI